MTSKTFTVRAKAFSGQGVREHEVMVDDGRVRVWDPVGKIYTVCHSLTASAQKRILKLAEREV